MKSELIKAIVYSEFDERIGPIPKFSLPSDLSSDIMIQLGVKVFTILTTEGGTIPKNLDIVSFPSLNAKALVKYIEWIDEELRGGVGNAVIIILFNESDDVIFYKYIKELDPIFSETAKRIIDITESDDANQKKIELEIQTLIENLNIQLDNLKLNEESSIGPTPFPVVTSSKPENYQFKISICGDAEVGKTSLVLRFTDKAFRRSYLPTLGVNVSSKLTQVEESLIKLVIWDIAGQSKFEKMRTDFYRGSKSVFFVFDLIHPESFKSIRDWYEDLKNNLRDQSEFSGYLIGNKSDLGEARKITKEAALKLANDLNLKYVETSALNGANVDEIFHNISQELYNLYKDN
jgi:small GTP-binding protein